MMMMKMAATVNELYKQAGNEKVEHLQHQANASISVGTGLSTTENTMTIVMTVTMMIQMDVQMIVPSVQAGLVQVVMKRIRTNAKIFVETAKLWVIMIHHLIETMVMMMMMMAATVNELYNQAGNAQMVMNFLQVIALIYVETERSLEP